MGKLFIGFLSNFQDLEMEHGSRFNSSPPQQSGLSAESAVITRTGGLSVLFHSN